MKKLRDIITGLIKKYFIDSFYLALPRAIVILVGLISLPIVLANLAVDDYGKFQFVLAIQIWFIVLTGGYITTGAKRGIARGLEGTFLYAFFARFKFLVIIGLFGFFVSFYLYTAGLATLSILSSIMSAFIIFGYLFQISFLEFFVAKKQFKNSAIWRIIVSVSSIAISTIAAYFTHNILIFAITRLGSTAIISWAGWLYVVKKNNLISEYRKEKIDRDCVLYGKRLIPAEIILATTNKIANFIIGPFFGFTNLAVFSIADKLGENFRGFMKISHSLFYSDFAKNEQKKIIRILRARLGQGMIISIIITLICVIIGYFYITLFLPESYHKAILYFLILSLGLPVVILEMLMRTILEVNFRYKELTILIILPNLIKILFILGLGLLFGVIGVCWGIALGAWFSFGLYYFLTIKIDKFPLFKKISNF